MRVILIVELSLLREYLFITTVRMILFFHYEIVAKIIDIKDGGPIARGYMCVCWGGCVCVWGGGDGKYPLNQPKVKKNVDKQHFTCLFHS